MNEMHVYVRELAWHCKVLQGVSWSSWINTRRDLNRLDCGDAGRIPVVWQLNLNEPSAFANKCLSVFDRADEIPPHRAHC